MDEKQSRIVDVLLQHKDCLGERPKLKGLLADYLQDDKMHQNLILYAYDEDFHTEINQANEKALVAIQYIKVLEDSYGISAQNAKWSIEVWCAILGYKDIVEAFSLINASSTEDRNSSEASNTSFEDKEYVIGIGLYCSGIDFPPGRVLLSAKWERDKSGKWGGRKGDINFGIKATPDMKEWYDGNVTGAFRDQTYIDTIEGDFIKTYVFGGTLKEILVKKVSE